MTNNQLRPLVRPRSISPHRFPDDIKRLRDAINFLGFDAEDGDIADAYENFSDAEYSAGWMLLSSWESDQSAAQHLINNGYLVEAP